MDGLKVGLIGSGFVSTIHAEALKMVSGAEAAAVASPTEQHVMAFAEKHSIPNWFTDYREMLSLMELDVIVLGLPNHLHAEATVAAAKAGKHIICEKPLCMNLAEADLMIDTCREEGVKLMYAEELCFAPKYVRLKQLVDDGALGKVYLVKQSEKHDGPHADWFWDVELSGGGVTLDMGCHALEFFRWMLGKRKAVSVYAEMGTHVHRDRTKGDDNSIIIVRFEDGAVGMAEESWTKKGGMDDRAEVHGSEGVAYANLLMGNSILTYSDVGYGYAVEKAGATKGWSFTMYEETWNYGFPQEMQHFVDCIRNGAEPLETGEDGRAVLEMIFAAYESARTGKKVELPFATEASKPIDLYPKS
ncbi:Gfo/Idh/MocA family oxidoreductase [bacterium]|nr:Gfo/Idh/MocA family oxidoreductase [bacterium]